MAKEAKRDKRVSLKEVYEPPQLKPLGSLSRITKGPTGGAIDSIFGGIGGFTDPSPS